MEAPSPSITVEPCLPATSSRPGPVFGCGEGVFRNHILGKYHDISSNSLPKTNDASSRLLPMNCQPGLFNMTLGRTLATSLVEAPNSLITVEPLQPSFISRPSPVYELRDGGFQTPTSGKYNQQSTDSLPENVSTSSAPSYVVASRQLQPANDESAIPAPSCSSTIIHPETSACLAARRLPRTPDSSDLIMSNAAFIDCNRFIPVSRSDSPAMQPVCSQRATGIPLPASSQLRMYYQNVRGLRTKIDAFCLAVADAEYDVIVLTETWLDNCILSTQLFGGSFTVFRTDRTQLNSRKRRGGGVLIAVSSRLCCCIDPAPVSDALEQLWVKIKFPTHSVSIGVIYLPPDRRDDLSLIRLHSDSISSVLACLKPHDIALQFGDYNHPNMRWTDSGDDGGLMLDSRLSRISTSDGALYDAFCFNGLSQINFVKNANEKILDLVLVNEPALPNCAISEAIEPLVGADIAHPAIDIAVSLPLPVRFEQPQVHLRFDFRRVDYDVLSEALSAIDWQFLDDEQNLDDIVESFSREIRRVIEAIVPLQHPPLNPPWTNSRLRTLKRRRRATLRRYKRNRTEQRKRRFVRASNKYTSYNRRMYARYIDRTQRNLRLHPKRFWSFVRSKRKESGLPSSMFLGARSASTDIYKCELFADHFKSVFIDMPTSPSHVEAAIRDTPSNRFDFGVFQVTEEHVRNALRKLKSSVSSGLDGIPACILKNCASALVIPLVKLFNISLQQTTFPSAWKASLMTPIHKKGDKGDITNYRGITSLSACSKVFEIIVNDALFETSKNYISTAQHGFFPKRSVTTNLTQFTSLCIRSMDDGMQVDAIYTDFKAAFDRVNHDILLGKLAKLGVSAAFATWFKSYLSGRSMSVKIGSSQSTAFPIPSGVPQGSNLGPLLFSLFINDAAFILPSGTRVFYADDVKIYMVIKCTEDCMYLQRLLDAFEDWSKRNSLELCITKCNAISFARKRQPITFHYRLGGHVLERLNQVRDLGVILDSELNFRTHYNDVIAKANRQLGFIFKLADGFCDPLCLKSLYCALVRSILESAVLVWCPYSSIWVNRIESVQRKFVRLALRHLPWRDRLNLPPYEHRCMLLGIETLEKRRSDMQAIFVAKVLMSEVDAPAILADISLYVPERPLRRRHFLHLGSRNSRYGQHDPIRFMASRFNDVSEHFDLHLPAATLQRRLRNLN